MRALALCVCVWLRGGRGVVLVAGRVLCVGVGMVGGGGGGSGVWAVACALGMRALRRRSATG